jgi:DNA repair protein RadC
MPITDWAPDERPREKLLARGPAALSDAELLAVCLRTGVPGKTALDVARELLAGDGLRGLLADPAERTRGSKGLGAAKRALLLAIAELGRRYAQSALARGAALTSPADAQGYLAAQLRDRAHEVFACLFLDTRHRVIAFEELFRGTLDGASVYPREVAKAALRHNAAALILAHNHPSGVAEPSAADLAITRRLKDALALLDVRVLDHVIVGDGACVSMAESGVL